MIKVVRVGKYSIPVSNSAEAGLVEALMVKFSLGTDFSRGSVRTPYPSFDFEPALSKHLLIVRFFYEYFFGACRDRILLVSA